MSVLSFLAMKRRSDKVPTKTPSDGLRAQNKRDKRERVRKAAWDLFTTEGYEQTTTRAIAERAGIATGTLFLYAKDKRDLLFLVMEERIIETVEAAFRTLPRRATLEAELLHVIRKILAIYSESPDVGRQFVKELPGASGPNAERVHAQTLAFFQRIAALVERARVRGEVREDVPPLVFAQSFFALYFMALMQWLSGFTPLDQVVDVSLRPMLVLLLQGAQKH